jgi:hypothetical protein
MADKIIPVALKIWLLFLFLFLLLGYGVPSSIIFGAIAGFAGGMIQAWWTTPGGEPTETALPEPIRQFGRQIKETPRRLSLPKLFPWRASRYPRGRR